MPVRLRLRHRNTQPVVRLRLRHRDAQPASEEVDDDLAGRRLPEGAPPVRGQRALTAVLPSGRVLWLRTPGRVAPLGEVNRSLAEARRLGQRRAAAVKARRQEVARLSVTVAADAERLSTAR